MRVRRGKSTWYPHYDKTTCVQCIYTDDDAKPYAVYTTQHSPGGVITSQTTPCRNFGSKEGGGRIFKGGVLVGDYGTNNRIIHEGESTIVWDSTICSLMVPHVGA